MFIGRSINGQTRDLGPLLPFPCPDCDQDQWFHLQEHLSSVNLLGMQAGKHQSYSLHCKKCKFPVDLPDEDAEKAIAFLPTAHNFLAGELEKSNFQEKATGAGFAFLKEIEDANTNWTCPRCREESPLTFDTCWNCGHTNES